MIIFKFSIFTFQGKINQSINPQKAKLTPGKSTHRTEQIIRESDKDMSVVL